MIYIASPYSHKERRIMEHRYDMAEHAMAQMLMDGDDVYSPIAMTHWAAIKHDLPTQSSWWRKHNGHFLKLSEELRVLKMEGWMQSEGVQWEINFALSNDIPISYWRYEGRWKKE